MMVKTLSLTGLFRARELGLKALKLIKRWNRVEAVQR
jgi:hypothetical protein